MAVPITKVRCPDIVCNEKPRLMRKAKATDKELAKPHASFTRAGIQHMAADRNWRGSVLLLRISGFGYCYGSLITTRVRPYRNLIDTTPDTMEDIYLLLLSASAPPDRASRRPPTASTWCTGYISLQGPCPERDVMQMHIELTNHKT